MSIDIDERDIEESVIVHNERPDSSNSDVKHITPTALKKSITNFRRKDTSEGLIHSTRSIQLSSATPKKKTPTNIYHTVTSLNAQHDKFLRMDANNELEFMYSHYFNLKDENN